MTAIQPIEPAATEARFAERRVLSAIADDKAMLRAAAELTRDIGDARPGIYWPDMLGSAAIGYVALAGAILWRPSSLPQTYCRTSLDWTTSTRNAISSRLRPS